MTEADINIGIKIDSLQERLDKRQKEFLAKKDAIRVKQLEEQKWFIGEHQGPDVDIMFPPNLEE